MNITIHCFGEPRTVEVPQNQLIDFPTGLVGFEQWQRFALIELPDSPVKWVQCLEEEGLSLPVIEPFLVVKDYDFEIPDADVRVLRLTRPEDAHVLVVLTIRDDPEHATANLLAPIVINRAARRGRQLVLQGDQYSLRHPVFPATAAFAPAA
jgi:flagellar assembly factor FliW